MKKLFYFISVLFVFTVNNALDAQFFGGTGTPEDPWQITSLAELDSVRDYPDSNFILMNDLDFAGSAYDSANSTEGWEPICNSTIMFTGSFNGSGYAISNLYINRPSDDYMGLFGYANNATIDSLAVINCNITGNNHTGGLVGRNSSSTISNCYAAGNVSGNTMYTGGLVGYNDFSSTVSNCYATGSISGQSYTGGLVGYNYSSSIVSNCYTTGSVSGNSVVGGLVGYNYSSTISNCYTTGSISGQSYTGGLVGYNSSSGTVSNGYYNTETSGQNSGIGTDNNSQTVTGLTTALMKQQSSFTGFDFNIDWGIRIDSTYPALRDVNNAPFVFADTLIIGTSTAFSALMTNDYDYETLQESLTLKIISVDTGYVKNERIYFFPGVENGDTIKVEYRVGEVMALVPDTLWGNSITSILILNNSAPVLSAVSVKTTPEDTPVTLSMSDVTATDADSDTLNLVVYTGENYTVDGSTVTPDADYYGTLSVPLSVTDGIDTSNVMNMIITVTEVTSTPEISRTDIQIYPNPAKESFRIIGIEKTTEVILLDMTGQVVLTKEISGNELISVGSLPEGIYYLVVKGENTVVKKLCIF